MTMRALVAAGLLVATAIAGVSPAAAQNFPTRPITMIVPFAAGGGTDAVGRAIADTMSSALGQTVVIENAGGGGGTIGAVRAARAAPDGYTILLHQPGLAAAVSLYPKFGINPEKDLVGVGLVNVGSLMIVGHKSLQGDTLKDLVDGAKKSGKKLTFGHPGAGSMGHFCGALLQQALQAPIDLVPYRGGGPAMADTIAGHVDLTCVGLNFGVEQMEAGTLKGFGITGREPFAPAPKVEPLAIAYPDLDLPYWHALFAPAGTPQPIIDRLNAALRKSFSDPRVQKIFASNGMAVYPESQHGPEAATTLLSSEIKRLGEVIRVHNIKPQ
ncbi:MAG: tripartite tricarboxylate transporter substrate-binding protein [Pseudolabrys sp.]|nr:tripartite tricarboxylate transporter substrate-binding protein [Pseudolabrys sp.]